MRPAAGLARAAAATLALTYGGACLLLALLMAASWHHGRPLTSPLQLADPGLTLLVPGEVVDLPGLAAPLRVTATLVAAVAGAHLLVLGGAGALWIAAGAGLLRRRRWARALALGLFGATVAVGLLNLALAVALLAAGGGAAAVAGALPTLGATFLLLVLLPGGAAAGLLAPGAAAAFPGAAGGAGPGLLLRGGVCLHFLLLGVLLAAGALAPARGPVLLIGPWPVDGAAGRALSLILGLVHLATGIGLLARRRPAWHGAWWLTATLGALAAASALTAGARALALASGGLLPAATTRGLLAMAALLAGALLWSLGRLRPLRPPGDPAP